MVQLFSTAVIDQLVLSVANFLLGFLLIRYTTDADYSLFVIAQSSVTLLVSAQTASLAGPLVVIVPKKPADARREMIGRA